MKTMHLTLLLFIVRLEAQLTEYIGTPLTNSTGDWMNTDCMSLFSGPVELYASGRCQCRKEGFLNNMTNGCCEYAWTRDRCILLFSLKGFDWMSPCRIDQALPSALRTAMPIEFHNASATSDSAAMAILAVGIESIRFA